MGKSNSRKSKNVEENEQELKILLLVSAKRKKRVTPGTANTVEQDEPAQKLFTKSSRGVNSVSNSESLQREPDSDNGEGLDPEFLDFVRTIRQEEWDALTRQVKDYRILLSVVSYAAVAVLSILPIVGLMTQSCNMDGELGLKFVGKFFQYLSVKYVVMDTVTIFVKIAISMIAVTFCSGQDLSSLLKKIKCCRSENKLRVHPTKSSTSHSNLHIVHGKRLKVDADDELFTIFHESSHH